MWLVTSRRRIQRVGTVSDSQNLITHLKAVSSTLAVPAGMPMSRVAPAAAISSWRRSRSPGKSANSDCPSRSVLVTPCVANWRAMAAVRG